MIPTRADVDAERTKIAAASIAQVVRVTERVLTSLVDDHLLQMLARELRRLAGDVEARRYYLNRRQQ